MPGKTKKLIQNTSSNIGFLRPTLASQRRCVHSQPQFTVVNNKKKNPEKTRKKSFNHSTFEISKQNEVRSAVELYGARSPLLTSDNGCHEKTAISQVQCHNPRITTSQDLTEARKMCEELQKQINELKLNQENFQNHRQALEDMDRLELTKSHSTQTSARLIDDGFEKPKVSQTPYHPNSVIKVNVKSRQKPFLDTSNAPTEMDLPNAKVYQAAFKKSDSPSKVIKKLYSERDKYKNKVVKLQTELKLVKQNRDKVTKSPEIAMKDLSFYSTDMVGEGRLAVVYAGELCGQKVAVKKLTNSGVLSSSDRSYLTAEADLLIHLQHKHIVKVYGVCSSPMEPLIIGEFVYGATVADLLNDTGGIEPAKYFTIARDTAIGMAYLHNQKPPVLHLNLLPSNIFVDIFGRAKVSDFGFSKIRAGTAVCNSASLAYLAPELLKCPVHLTVKVDVFAYAIILWQMHSGADPLHGRSASQILDMLQNGERLPLPHDMPLSFHTLTSKCWTTSPVQRPTFKEIILELETMPLPAEWVSILREAGVSRMDTSDLSSSAQESSSISSGLTATGTTKALPMNPKRNESSKPNSSACDKEPGLTTGATAEKGGGETVPGLVDDKQRASKECSRVQYCNSTPHDQQRHFSEPAPCNEVRYISQNIDEQIGQSQVVDNGHTLPNLFLGVDQLQPHVSMSRPARYNTMLRATNHQSDLLPSDALGRRDGSSATRTRPTFDDKFQSYVNDACQAESASKLGFLHSHKARSGGTLSSSDHIRVHSLSTPSDTAAHTADQSSSSTETAVYLPPRTRPPRSLKSAPSTDETSARYFDATRSVADRLREEYRRSDLVLCNAKRLLSTSPLKRRDRDIRSSKYLDLPSASKSKSRSLPSQYHRTSQSADVARQRYAASDPLYVPLPSPRSEDVMSQESFVQLPPKLNSRASYVSPLNVVSTDVGEAWKSMRHQEADPYLGNFPADREGVKERPEQVAESGEADKVADVLQSTAEQLNDVSTVLQSAADERRSLR